MGQASSNKHGSAADRSVPMLKVPEGCENPSDIPAVAPSTQMGRGEGNCKGIGIDKEIA